MKQYVTKLQSGHLGPTQRKRILRRARRDEEVIQEQIRMSFVTDREFKEWLLRAAERQWSKCRACPLRHERTNVCYGEGDAEPIMVVVAEAPGEQEDLHTRTLYGSAGTIFRRVCARVGIDVSRHCYLTNSAICRPPKNRKPEKAEREACRPRLLGQLEILQPHVLLLLGKSAMKILEDMPREFRVADYRGKIPRKHWPTAGARNLKLVYGTYHPSFPLRQQTKQKKRMKLQLIVDDLKKIKSVLDLVQRRRDERTAAERTQHESDDIPF